MPALLRELGVENARMVFTEAERPWYASQSQGWRSSAASDEEGGLADQLGWQVTGGDSRGSSYSPMIFSRAYAAVAWGDKRGKTVWSLD